jgi:hypothetical protein
MDPLDVQTSPDQLGSLTNWLFHMTDIAKGVTVVARHLSQMQERAKEAEYQRARALDPGLSRDWREEASAKASTIDRELAEQYESLRPTIHGLQGNCGGLFRAMMESGWMNWKPPPPGEILNPFDFPEEGTDDE